MPLLETALIAVGSGLISALAGSGESPQEEAIRKVYDKLYNEMDWLKSAPFTKDELFNKLLPSIQQAYKGAANVAAGQLGASVGESGLPQGQAIMDYYVQALAPVIAQGQNNSANAEADMAKLWAMIDNNAKGTFLNATQLAGNLASGLPEQTSFQKFFTNFLQGADIGSTIYGNIQMGDALTKQANSLQDLSKLFGNQDMMKAFQDWYKNNSNNFSRGGNN